MFTGCVYKYRWYSFGHDLVDRPDLCACPWQSPAIISGARVARGEDTTNDVAAVELVRASHFWGMQRRETLPKVANCAVPCFRTILPYGAYPMPIPAEWAAAIHTKVR